MEPEVIAAFVKHAIGMGAVRALLKARASQGVGGAEALARSLSGGGAQTSRQAVQGMSGLQRHQLKGVLQGGREVRQMQRLPERVGLGQTAQTTRTRVERAIQEEAAAPGVSRAGGVPLSRAYEGYMSPVQTSYSPQHVEQVMGLRPGSYTPKVGPTKLMKPKPQGSFGGSDEATVPSSPLISGTRSKVDPEATTLLQGITSISRPRAGLRA